MDKSIQAVLDTVQEHHAFSSAELVEGNHTDLDRESIRFDHVDHPVYLLVDTGDMQTTFCYDTRDLASYSDVDGLHEADPMYYVIADHTEAARNAFASADNNDYVTVHEPEPYPVAGETAIPDLGLIELTYDLTDGPDAAKESIDRTLEDASIAGQSITNRLHERFPELA